MSRHQFEQAMAAGVIEGFTENEQWPEGVKLELYQPQKDNGGLTMTVDVVLGDERRRDSVVVGPTDAVDRARFAGSGVGGRLRKAASELLEAEEPEPVVHYEVGKELRFPPDAPVTGTVMVTSVDPPSEPEEPAVDRDLVARVPIRESKGWGSKYFGDDDEDQ